MDEVIFKIDIKLWHLLVGSIVLIAFLAKYYVLSWRLKQVKALSAQYFQLFFDTKEYGFINNEVFLTIIRQGIIRRLITIAERGRPFSSWYKGLIQEELDKTKDKVKKDIIANRLHNSIGSKQSIYPEKQWTLTWQLFTKTEWEAHLKMLVDWFKVETKYNTLRHMGIKRKTEGIEVQLDFEGENVQALVDDGSVIEDINHELAYLETLGLAREFNNRIDAYVLNDELWKKILTFFHTDVQKAALKKTK